MALPDETSTPAEGRTAYSPTRTWVWISIVLVLLAISILPSLFSINRYQNRVAHIISASIGRPVHMSAVKLRLLPRPGFEMSDFVVDEDPAFGAEPMLHSPSVGAYVRLIPMWRGRLEIARIHFDDPSLNLVRRADGQWNFGSVLLKASAAPNAPTTQRHGSGVPRFPYIEATNARINFKAGDEKKPFSFLGADLSVWLDNPDEWRLRFEAQPVRTDLDLDLADTGILKVNGSIRRAATLNTAPLMLHAAWTKAPLGQLSRLLAGRDAGWRGDLEVRADITGTMEDALLKAQLKASSVHRIEFAPAEPMDLDANCDARYTRATHSLEAVACSSPLGKGHLLVRGAVREMQQNPMPVFDLQMQNVPVSAALGLARSVREGLAPNLKATGSIDGGFQYSGEASGTDRLRGNAMVSGLVLSAPLLDEPLPLPSLRLVAAGDDVPDHPRQHQHSPRKKRSSNVPEAAQLNEPALLLTSFELPAGGSSPLKVDGRFTAHRYQMHFAGSANIKSLVAYSKAFGLLAYTVNPLAPTGNAELDLRTAGAWVRPIIDSDQPGASSSTEGQLQLRNARITTDYLAAPLDVISAHALFRGSDVAWDSASVNYGKLHADGSLQYPQSCSRNLECLSTFKLKFAALDIGAAQTMLLGGSGRTQLLELLAKLDHREHPWPALRGTAEAATLTLNKLILHDASAALAIKGDEVAIQSFDGRTLGGEMHLTGTLDASGQEPKYAVDAEFKNVNVSEVAALFHEKWHDSWGAGQLSGKAQLQLAGYKAADLSSSASGTFDWLWTQGSAPVEAAGIEASGIEASRIEASGIEASGEEEQLLSGLPQFRRWNAEGTIAEGKLSLRNGNLLPASSDGPEAVRGTISFQRELDLVIGAASADGRTAPDASLHGTLAEPRVEANAVNGAAAAARANPASQTTTSQALTP